MLAKLSDLEGIRCGLVIDRVVSCYYHGVSGALNDNRYLMAPELPPMVNYAEQRHSSAACLQLETVHAMLRRFIEEKKMSRTEVAAKLGITIEELELLSLNKAPPKLVIKVNLPLIKLYCKTRWPSANNLP